MKKLCVAIIAVFLFGVLFFAPFTSGNVHAAEKIPSSHMSGSITSGSCGNHTDFLKIWYDNGGKTICFANKGLAKVALRNPTKFSSGNNAGFLLLEPFNLLPESVVFTKGEIEAIDIREIEVLQVDIS